MRTLRTRAVLLGGALALILATAGGLALAEDNQPKQNNDLFQQQAQRRLELMRRIMEQQQRMLGQAWDMPNLQGFGPMPGRLPGSANGREGRLGAEVANPSGTLVDQLDLPKNQGIVLEEVGANSAAGKAGLKKHDILLELNGKAVPSNVSEFRKVLSGIKANTAVDAVVMRKGKKETIKGLKLPEARAEAAVPGIGAAPLMPLMPNFPNPNGDVEKLFGQGLLRGGNSTSITRNNDQFTVRQNNDKGHVTVKGTLVEGKATVTGVVIDQGSGKKEYDSLEKVPAEYKQRVKDLVGMVAPKRALDEY